MLLHRLTVIVDPCFQVVYTQYAGIPVWMARRRLPRNHHNVSMRPRVDGVVFASEVIRGVMNLHRLDRVDSVVGNDYRVVFFVGEYVVAIRNI